MRRMWCQLCLQLTQTLFYEQLILQVLSIVRLDPGFINIAKCSTIYGS